MLYKKLFLILGPLFLSTMAEAASVDKNKLESQKFKVENLYKGEDVIWGFDFLDQTHLIFTQRDGKLMILDLVSKKAHEVSGAPKVFAESQGGLLDVFYDKNKKDIYLTYSDPDPKGASTSLFKGSLSADLKRLEGKRIFQSNAHAKGGIHFGSRVLLDKNNHLFMSVGERNNRDLAQDLSKHNGKILRLTTEGKAAEGNPFIGKPNMMPEIWSYGHRNPQGLILRENGDLLEAEFGPRGGDELNLVKAGLNYGWPIATYGSEYWGPKIGKNEVSGMTAPVKYWVPSISPSGIMEYTGDVFKEVKNNIFLANLAGSHIRRIVFDQNYKALKEDKLLEDLEDRFRQIKQGPEGLIYISTDSGLILRLAPQPK